MLILFVLLRKTWNVVKPVAWLARHPPGAQQSQNSSAILSKVRQGLPSQQAVSHSHSWSGQCPGRLQARSEVCSALSLKPKQDYLISVTEGRAFSPLQPFVIFLTHLRREGFEALKEIFVKATG